ncbi:DUF4397 domain-containing protein [Enterovibrio sp. FF113]|uniref:DUF4397 domain-containing protein n=1 Tax=Enterovibrio sp. FF113 TaxID=3230010 RepID=UPI00352EAD9F
MKRFISVGVLAAVAILSGCGSNDNNTSHTQSKLRIIHASADAPLVNVNANGTEILNSVNYGEGSQFLTVNAANYAVEVKAQLPDQSLATVLDGDYTLETERSYTAVALGSVADSTLELAIIENADSAIPSGNARIQVLHGSPDVGTVDIYATAPTADIADSAPALTLDYRSNSDQIDLPVGDYRIRITPNGSKTVVYDSGAVPLANGNDLFITAIPNVYAGAASVPVALLVANGERSSLILDANTGADVRVIHEVADAPAVDVFLDGSSTAAVTGLTFSEETGFLTIPAGDHTVTVTAPSVPVTVINNVPVNLETGAFYSAIAYGSVDATDSADITLGALKEDRRSVATEAKLSVFHASVSAGVVDIYVTADGDIGNAAPSLTGVSLGQGVSGIRLPAGSLFVTVTPTGTKTEAIGPAMITVEAGKVYELIAQDSVGGGSPLGVNAIGF